MNLAQDTLLQQKPTNSSHSRFLQPFPQQLGIVQHPADWEEGLTSEEFLSETKKCYRKNSMVEIKYHRNVLLFLDELTDILIDKGYFSFYENSAQYMEDLVSYIKKNIAIKQQNPAPPYFSKYGDDLLYITYKRNKQTTVKLILICRKLFVSLHQKNLWQSTA
jgi:hypothetical protein